MHASDAVCSVACTCMCKVHLKKCLVLYMYTYMCRLKPGIGVDFMHIRTVHDVYMYMYIYMYTSQADGKWKLQELTLVFNLAAEVFNLTEGTCAYTCTYSCIMYMCTCILCKTSAYKRLQPLLPK